MEKSNIISVSKLFDRPPETSYLEEWVKLLSQSLQEMEVYNETSFVVFRLANELFAISALVFVEITPERAYSTIPCSYDPIMLGVVNMRGQLRLCFSLQALLGFEKEAAYDFESKTASSPNHFMLAITDKNNTWAFSVDDVVGVSSFDLKHMSNVPVNLLNSQDNYLKGMFKLNEKNVFVLDEDLLFQDLRRRKL